MKPKITIAISLIFLWTPVILKAQIAPEVSQKFPANIVTRIYSVTSKVKLPIEKQILLGAFFKTQDSLANIAIAKGASAAEVNKYYNTKPENLSGILSPLELNDFLIIKDGTASKFGVAIKYREQLNLSKAQIDSMFLNMDILKSVKKKGWEIKKYEAEHLTKILKNDQYRSLLLIINKEKALMATNDAWQQLKQLGLTSGLDSIRENAAMLIYQDNKIIAAEYAATTGDASKNNAIAIKPLLLQKMDVLNGEVAAKELAAAVRYRDELRLTNKQVEALVNYAVQLQNWVTTTQAKVLNAKVDPRKNELTLLFKILNTEDKYNQYLTIKNLEKAQKNATADWAGLRQFEIMSGKDSVQTNKECLQFETNVLISVERMLNSKTPEKADSVKKALYASRPKYLLKLSAYKKTLPKSQFAEAIDYRKDLILDENQIDQLLDKSSKLEFLKLSNKSQGVPEFTKTREFEGTNLIAILNEVQYGHYLLFKSRAKAHDYAQKDWNKMKQFGLTKGLDSAKVRLETLNYETNMQIAIERLKNENNQKNIFFKKQAEAKKPEYLKQLDLTVKNLAANDDAKKALTW
jgi:hypothetical protein